MGSHYRGFEVHAIVPDIVVMGKGIGNGFPLATVVAKREIAESMAPKKFFNTYGSNPMACAAGRAVLAAIDEDGIQENAKLVGGLIMSGLERLKQRHGIIGDVRGRGLMLGVELVKDRKTKEPALEETIRVHEIAKQNGLIMGRGGTYGNVLRINPPMCLTAEDAAFFEETLDASFHAPLTSPD